MYVCTPGLWHVVSMSETCVTHSLLPLGLHCLEHLSIEINGPHPHADGLASLDK